MKMVNTIISRILDGIAVYFTGFHKVLQILREYKEFYLLLGLILPKKTYEETDQQYQYGIIICARNEQAVIGNLIDSIYAQTYDATEIKIFVVADNCSDDTARICRDKGCIVYERYDTEHMRKGYAMEFLFERIRCDYGIDSCDGYIILDADNLLNPTYIEEMNKAFATGAKVVVGYRNTKNFDTNFISAGYGIHFYQSTVMYHRPRVWLGLSTHIAGTGYLIASELLSDGWHYTCLTEDTEFTLNSIARGQKIIFCEDAEFYDEQPYEVRVMARQRIRWIRGRMFSFFSTFGKLVRGLFQGGLKHAFSCYDMLVYAFPHSTFYGLGLILLPVLRKVISITYSLMLGHAIGIGQGAGTAKPLWMVVWVLAETNLRFILQEELKGVLIVIREYKHIRCSLPRLIIYALVFPWFDIVGAPLAIVAIFTKSQWKPIKHDQALTLNDLGILGKKKE